MSKRFCVFVDGLDEYYGAHRELIDLLRSFAFSDHFKFCVSSRPWNVFEDAFGSDYHRKFRLEDLTRNDIKLYVKNKLEEDRLFCQLRVKEPRRCDDLSNEVVDKAQGIFLWVYLVVRSLGESLTNADRIIDLQRRLRALPSDLVTYFRHMLGTIESIYAEQTVRTFRIAIEAPEPLTLMTYAMLDEIEENPAFAIELEVREMAQSKIDSLHNDMRLRINARCKDLLVVSRVSINPASPLDYEVGKPETRKSEGNSSVENDSYKERIFRGNLSSNPFFEYEVNVLHRTVRDFFRVEDVQAIIVGRTLKNFNPNGLLCQAFLAQIKSVPLKPEQLIGSGPLSDLVDDMTHYAADFQWQSGLAPTALLDKLSHTMAEQTKLRGPVFFSNPKQLDRSLRQIRHSFLGYAVQKDLGLYVQEELSGRPLPVIDSSIILGALQLSITSKYGVKTCADENIARSLARLLLESDIDLESRTSKWSIVIAEICSQWSSMIFGARFVRLRILIMLLEVGADPGEDEDALRWVEFVLIPPENWKKIDLMPLKFFKEKEVFEFLHNGANLDDEFPELARKPSNRGQQSGNMKEKRNHGTPPFQTSHLLARELIGAFLSENLMEQLEIEEYIIKAERYGDCEALTPYESMNDDIPKVDTQPSNAVERAGSVERKPSTFGLRLFSWFFRGKKDDS
ncbi:hypothetical protein MMC28_009203 [Mycoblastus sanguinarius]|nr:hypothetical protein [Mycoblastus sanguinarius]